MNEKRIIDEFLELVQIDSHSSKEGKIAGVLIKKLEALGFDVYVDDAGKKLNGETGNIIATLKGTKDTKKILFSSHMDTVSPGEGVKPVIDEEAGIIKTDGTTILGSDDKAGIVATLEGVRMIKENNLEHGDIQVAFSIWEEGGLNGAKHMDYSKIDADFSFVLDSGGSPGEVITQAPAQDAIKVKIQGKPAHAGLMPEKGISAVMVAARAIEKMNLLRIDEETTANIGTINGGIATNIVMPELEITAEARSLCNDKLAKQSEHMKKCFEEACEEFNTTCEVDIVRSYSAFKIEDNDEIIDVLRKAFDNMGVETTLASTGGGSDTNIMNKNGLKAVILGVGMKKVHTLEEYIAIKDLVDSAKMVFEIIKSV